MMNLIYFRKTCPVNIYQQEKYAQIKLLQVTTLISWKRITDFELKHLLTTLDSETNGLHQPHLFVRGELLYVTDIYTHTHTNTFF